MDGRTACRCVTARACAVSTGTHVWEGMVSEDRAQPCPGATPGGQPGESSRASAASLHTFTILTKGWFSAERVNFRTLLSTSGLKLDNAH